MNNTIKVKKLPIDTGPAAWNSILSPANTFPTLEEEIIADWLVIGAGFAGIAAAKRLSQLVGDERLVMIEARRIAEGPAGRNSGFMIDLPHELNSESYTSDHRIDLSQIKLNRYAIDFAKQIALDAQMPIPVFNPCGKVTGAVTDKGLHHIESYSKHLASLGEPYEFMDAQALKEMTGIDYYRRGLFTPGAVMIQPAAFIRMAAENLRKDVEIYENTPALSIEKGDMHQVKTPKGNIRARRIILAVNGHIQSFGFFPKRLLHVFTYASMTRALSSDELVKLGGQSDWGILPADPMGTTVRRISNFDGSGDRVTVRNHFTLNQSMEVSERHIRTAAKLHDKAFRQRFPILNNVVMEHRWGGRLCLSLNSVPAFGELEPRIFSASCQNGLGTVKGTLSGNLAAELSLGIQSDILSEFQSSAAPKKLPPEPFLSLGANSVMRWKEFQAGIEL
ncbi:NAD(P)/FAD-dependent oxidoreductase [Nitrincola nitratireducens]|uniref:Gamma-glutamylputrescine oxidoreductase n=1 Tax=Nitrincola nitratireducens TaxID=1229521 RepID=W9VPW8_9GAMM|nr:FAD-binding oxidoreductase [Nitrincola nitratireducens]EXJ12485.1 Gamma-glutamylputrescine oxidoreductase [Nitrincola nitratireducens]